MSMIPQDDIVIDGDTAWLFDSSDPQRWWEYFNRPCDTCDGSGMDDDVIDCAHCSGTGRHTFNIHLAQGRHETLTVHVLGVLPIVEVDGQPEGVECVDVLGNHWHPDIDREGEPVHYLEGHTTMPPNAAPDQWAVKLAIQKEET